MSLVHRIFRITPPSEVAVDPSRSARIRAAEVTLNAERQELRQKMQKVESGARVMRTMAGAMMMMRGEESGETI